MNEYQIQKTMDEYNKMLAKANRDVEHILNKAPAYRRRAILKMENEDYEGAIDDFTIAIKLKRKHSNTWYYRGLCFCNLKMYIAAMNDYQMALKFRPNKSDVWCELGRIMHILHDNERADEYLSRAIQINRQHTEALQLRGFVRLVSGKAGVALIDLNKALRISPFNAWGRTARGMVYQTMQRWEDAREDYDISISLEPDALAYLNRAEVHYNLEQYAEALADAKKALEMEPGWEECQEVIDELEEEMDY